MVINRKSIIYQATIILSSCLMCSLCGKREAFITLLTLFFLLYSLVINQNKRTFINIWVILPVSLFILYHFLRIDISLIHNHVMWTYLGLQFVIMFVGYTTGFFLSKLNVRTVYLIAMVVLAIVLHIGGNLISFPLSFMTTGVIYLITPYIVYRYISHKLYVPLIFVAPFLLFNLEPWLSGSITALPLTLIPFCSVGFFYLAFLLKRRRIVQYSLLGTYLVFLLFGWYKGYEDYRQWIFVQEAKLAPDTNVNYLFYDIDGNPVTPTCLEGKILVFDFWSTSCGVCFREFPKFEKVYQKYKHRDDICFYAVYLPIKDEPHETIKAIIKDYVNYSFPVLLADKDTDYWTKFKINGVPHLMILDRKGKVVFNGGANYDKKIVFNIENMIDRLLD